MTRYPSFRTFIRILTCVLVLSLTGLVQAAPDSGTLSVIVSDGRTNEALGGAMVYLDGEYHGLTTISDNQGTLVIPDVSGGKHTIRITKAGYREASKKIITPTETTVSVSLLRGSLLSLNPEGPTPAGINIVFYPSSTSYNCTGQQKVSAPLYMENETKFREDVNTIINRTYMSLDKDTSGSVTLPANYQNLFNFYYYYDPQAPADAFAGCSGSVPEQYFTEVPFNDLTVIVYPTYYGLYSGSPCQPTGCYQDFGPGRSLMKAPADKIALFRHETGHAVFGLVDTYCGETYYYQNDPYPNVWASLDACKVDARENNRDPEQCRQIEKKSSTSVTCQKNYWQWDPMPDIMASGYSGSFGSAATQRISYVISRAGAE